MKDDLNNNFDSLCKVGVQHRRTCFLAGVVIVYTPDVDIVKVKPWVKLWDFAVRSMDEILKCDHSNASYWVALCRGTFCYVVQGGSNFRTYG